MLSSARLFNCARCHCQVVICSHCDRDNIYCGERCSKTARNQSRRKASGRYQRTRRGRFAHAERQRRYRQRRTAKVTHQGSPLRWPMNAGIPLDEKTPIAPQNPYATSKAAAELIAQSYVKLGLHLVVARPFNHIGPGQTGGSGRLPDTPWRT